MSEIIKVEHLKEFVGKKICVLEFGILKKVFLCGFSGNGDAVLEIEKGNVVFVHPESREFRAYEEPTKPKKKVKMWQWIMENKNHLDNFPGIQRCMITPDFFENELSVAKFYQNAKDYSVLKRADWSEIEVEE